MVWRLGTWLNRCGSTPDEGWVRSGCRGIATAPPSFQHVTKNMLFTIQTGPLIRMVELVGEGAPNRRPLDSVVRVAATRDRVCVKCGGTTAETDATVWEDGQC